MPDTGWTHVRHKTRRRPKHHNHNQTQTQSQPPSETFTPRTTNLRSASALEADYANFHSQWLDSSCRASLIRIVHDHIHTNTNTASPEITNAVCLGIGTFDPEDGGWETKRSAYMQLCAFTTLVSELETITNSSIKCTHQEPILTTSDKTFLSNLGHEIVSSPQVYTSITNTTLLFGIHLYRPIYALALQNCTPAIFVGTGWDIWDEVTMEKSDDLKNLKVMENTHLKADFPQDPSSTAFSSTSLYFKPQKTDDEKHDVQHAKQKGNGHDEEKDGPKQTPAQAVLEVTDSESNNTTTTYKPIHEPSTQDTQVVPTATTKPKPAASTTKCVINTAK